ncbi:hypothetical protein [Mangrovibrevibacter kandeliae]|uniref:hypothetical protein n=1 Tax=Mangrovibrevibacter kandeliae TaxID=2968473 RepID=UPI002118D870|nr:hypothetical protein [Aurantimonas sp. CSK15Z-1]MCQ8781627.1 hypothetical protein [Aurantimonas sp. CSK15Z-1]
MQLTYDGISETFHVQISKWLTLLAADRQLTRRLSYPRDNFLHPCDCGIFDGKQGVLIFGDKHMRDELDTTDDAAALAGAAARLWLLTADYMRWGLVAQAAVVRASAVTAEVEILKREALKLSRN